MRRSWDSKKQNIFGKGDLFKRTQLPVPESVKHSSPQEVPVKKVISEQYELLLGEYLILALLMRPCSEIILVKHYARISLFKHLTL